MIDSPPLNLPHAEFAPMPNRRLFVLLLGFLAGLSPLAIDTYLPSLPAIARDLVTSPSSVQLSISVYLAFFAIPQLFFGPLSDSIGRRPTVLFGLGSYVAGSIICALAPNIEALLAARALQATGASALAVAVPALVRDRYSAADYTSTMGFVMMVMSVAPLFAPMLGSAVLEISGWRAIFWLLAIFGVICALLFARAMEESLALGARTQLNWKALLHNYKLLFGDRHCLGLATSSSFVFAGLMTFITSSPFVYIELYGIPARYFGFLFGINVLVLVALTYLNNRLVYRYRSEYLLRFGIACVLLASALLFVLSMFPKPPLITIIVAAALFVGNLSLITANVMGILMTRFAHISGSTAAMTGTLRFGIAALVGAAVSLLHSETSQALTGGMAVCGVCMFFSYLAAGKAPIK